MDFAQRVRTYRKAKNMTQQELADALGVSNKTVSRWEAEGSYPDPPTLLRLARALGVTVDDLLDDKKPLRTLTAADWQGLLAFAFAIGGGILFYLLELFTPTPVCYGVYLAAMLYGCYLQRYYTYRSRWFFWSNLGMNLAVNLSAGAWLVNGALALVVYAKVGVQGVENPEILSGMLGMGSKALIWTPVIGAAVGAALTAVTQYFIRRWMGGKGLTAHPGKAPRLGVKVCRPSRWSLLPVALAFLLPCYFLLFNSRELPGWLYENQYLFFRWAWLAVSVLSLLPFLKKGRRGQIVPVLLLVLILCGMPGVFGEPEFYWNSFQKAVRPWKPEVSSRYFPFQAFRWPMPAVSAAASAVFLLTSLFRPKLNWVEKSAKPVENESMTSE